MLKIVHLSSGALALVLAAIAIARGGLPLTPSVEAIGLAFLGLLHLQALPALPRAGSPRPVRVIAASLLLLLATALSALASYAPLPDIAGVPASLIALLFAAVATASWSRTKLSPPSRGRPEHGVPAKRAPRRAAPGGASSPGLPGRKTGTVKWFNTSKGFGFICPDEGEDVFVHFRAIRGQGHRFLLEGQRVEFSVQSRERGLQAEDVIALG